MAVQTGPTSPLVSTIRRLYELVPEEFTLLASWAGEDQVSELSVTRSELASIVEQNRLPVSHLAAEGVVVAYGN